MHIIINTTFEHFLTRTYWATGVLEIDWVLAFNCSTLVRVNERLTLGTVGPLARFCNIRHPMFTVLVDFAFNVTFSADFQTDWAALVWEMYWVTAGEWKTRDSTAESESIDAGAGGAVISLPRLLVVVGDTVFSAARRHVK